ncbi:MAG TPA: uroporphyrinogen-III synthase [Parachlamydiaceae bacterium]|nr:uroporphyrinogen-III synthase [Parachlamydiaceae bacterium]
MKKTLYLGLELPPHLQSENVVHHPFIRIIPKEATEPDLKLSFENFKTYTHLIFTSKSAVKIFFDLAKSFGTPHEDIAKKTIISVGQRTAQKLMEKGVKTDIIASEETAEGIVKELTDINLENANILLPQSAIARLVVTDWLTKEKIMHTVLKIYHTTSNLPAPLPDLEQFHEIIFTSPSTVDAFIEGYGNLPVDIKLTGIGPVTERKLLSFKNN